MDPVGLSAVAVVLVAGAGVGLWRRRVDGRLRPVAPAPVPVDGAVEQTGGVEDVQEIERLDPALLARLGAEPGRVTLLQFSTAFCAPCRALRRISAEVVALLPEVRHVEVDAESHLDEVRELSIWRTPTLLILDADGRVTRRATGIPTKPHLIAALAALLRSV
ncbi:TlpA family protein disulfide reductase [Actinoplanes awajinensis]|uniref:TlpA family protein disulfide reductase n=1 Tax=Actinoplanes awajinensis TaxID=135946 RepID=UPI000A049EEF|nr:thioredoxin family protein [Actinoplanes awajinensis]